MNKLLFLITLLMSIFGSSLYAQESNVEFWNSYESLVKNGLMKDAVALLEKNLQEQLTKDEPIETVRLLEEYNSIIQRSNFETDEKYQKLTEFERLADVNKGVCANILHFWLMNNYRVQSYRWDLSYWQTFSFDGYKSGEKKTVNIENINDWAEYHREKALENIQQLQHYVLYSKHKQPESLSFTLYEYVLKHIIRELNNDKIPFDSNWYLNTEQFLKNSSNQTLKLYQELELYNWNKKELNNYQFWASERLKYVRSLTPNELKTNLYEEKNPYLKALQTLSVRLGNHPSNLGTFLEIASICINPSEQYLFPASLEFKDRNELAHTMITEALKKFPASRFEKDARRFINSLEEIGMSFSLKNQCVLGQANMLQLDYKNVNEAFISVYYIENPDDFKNNNFKKLKVKQVFSKQVVLEQNGKFNRHSKQFLLPKINKQGSYLILVAKNKNEAETLFQAENYVALKEKTLAYSFVSYSSFQVITKEENGITEFWIADILTGKPIAGAEILIKKSQNDQFKKEGITDKNGMYSYRAASYFSYVVSYKGEEKSSSMYPYTSYKDFKSQVEYAIFLDRGIYRPGQIVNFKVIAYKGEGSSYQVVPNHHLEIYLEDEDYNDLEMIEGRTNEFGSFSGSFRLPMTGLRLGSFIISVNDESDKYFSVEEYKRPSFEVKGAFVKENYTLNSLVEYKGNAKAFAGFGVSNAKVNVRVTTQGMWRYYGNEELILDTVLQTSSTGEFNLAFLAKVSEENKYGAFFKLDFSVTSMSGETQFFSDSKYIGTKIPEWKHEIPKEVFVNRKNYGKISLVQDDNPDLKNEIFQVKLYRENQLYLPHVKEVERAEYLDFTMNEVQKALPNVLFGGGIPKVESTLITTSSLKSNDSIFLQGWVSQRPGTYKVEMLFVTSQKDTVSETTTFTVISPTSKKDQHQQALWVTAEKEVYEVGESIDVFVGSSYPSMSCFIEVKRGDELISREFVTLKGRLKRTYKMSTADLGGLDIYVHGFIENTLHKENLHIFVPFTEKSLRVKLLTKREILSPGAIEKWTLQVEDPKNQIALSEMLVSMYDASLDAFALNRWSFSPYFSNFSISNWRLPYSNLPYFQQYGAWKSVIYDVYYDDYGYRSDALMDGDFAYDSPIMTKSLEYEESIVLSAGVARDITVSSNKENLISTVSRAEEQRNTQTQVRKNFQETAFFYPTIYANKEGKYEFEFTLPDALTRWNFQAFAHDKTMRIGSLEHSVVAQKELMVTPNAPRFLRVGDEFIFRVIVVNMTKSKQDVAVELEWFNPATNEVMKTIFGEMQKRSIQLEAGESKQVEWRLNIPTSSPELVAYRISAQTAQFGDIEERMIPVLSNRSQLIESLPITVEGKGDYSFEMKNLTQAKSSTLEHKKLLLDYQSNPIWSAVLALPYLVEYPYDCAEQVFTKFYANELASYIVDQNPIIKTVFEGWKKLESSAFLSELDKNQELKSILLSETPWLKEAQSEADQRKRIALLFDANNQSNQSKGFLMKLEQMQNPDGGWSWFSGGKSSTYITQHILTGFSQLAQLEIDWDDEVLSTDVLKRATQFLNAHLKEEYKKRDTITNKKWNFSNADVQLLFVLAMNLSDNELAKKENPAFHYYVSQLSNGWVDLSLYAQALAGSLFLHLENDDMAVKIQRSLVNRSTKRKGLGTYWVENKGGYYWGQNAIETQATILNFLLDMEEKPEFIASAKLWLLNQKRGQYWESTKTTALACFALLNSSTSLSATSNFPTVKVGNQQIVFDANKRVPGQVTTHWNAAEIKNEMGKVTIQQANNEVNFASLTWIYTEEIDKIPSSKQGMFIDKKIYVKKGGKEIEVLSDTKLELGDILLIKMEIKTDRALEFVHVKDLRAAGTEPVLVLSSHRYENGLSFYQTSRDASTEFFLDYLPKGNHTLSYELVISASGKQSMGYSMIECLYAPEFRANSSSKRIWIGE